LLKILSKNFAQKKYLKNSWRWKKPSSFFNTQQKGSFHPRPAKGLGVWLLKVAKGKKEGWEFATSKRKQTGSLPATPPVSQNITHVIIPQCSVCTETFVV
jgi:hypothetical protein